MLRFDRRHLRHTHSTVMTGLVPVIHVPVSRIAATWMPATRAGMTKLVEYRGFVQ